MTVRLIFHCENCKLDWHDEAYCEACGASLMPTLRSVPDPEVSPWRALMDDIAHGNHRERNGR